MPAQPPLLARSHKTGQVRILTRYRQHPNGNTTVFESFDATTNFAAVVDELPIAREHRDAVLAAIGVQRSPEAEKAEDLKPAP